MSQAIFFLAHATPEPSIEPITDEMFDELDENDFEECTVDDFLEYWLEYHPNEFKIINFLQQRRITKCGTFEERQIDVFWVDQIPKVDDNGVS